MAFGDADDGGRGVIGWAARYFATISMTPDHWVPSSGILVVVVCKDTKSTVCFSFGAQMEFQLDYLQELFGNSLTI